ncbi:FAD binding domain-containing protein [Roseomonas sp. CAU 1739]|uniref:FAD binding domain-containing protein n=1 Tax=Roseomonas sp. CAU 1739 TaxID=3140364 RepID=UPI00325BFC81
MKPAAFDYHAPATLDHALALLAVHAEEARILAGGQSLVPTMAFRMARPGVLVDINRISALAYAAGEDGVLRIGALARHAWFETPRVAGPLGRLLPAVANSIAHAPIRIRGTFCGSLAHADPASEWCATVLALGGSMALAGPSGGREVAAKDWFQGVFTTAMQPGEILVEARLPLLDDAWRCGFAEFSRRVGDFALAMAVVVVRLEDGLIQKARIALGGIGATPVLAAEAAAELIGLAPSASAARLAARRASEACHPQEDLHATAAYRRDLVGAMVRRALEKAFTA